MGNYTGLRFVIIRHNVCVWDYPYFIYSRVALQIELKALSFHIALPFIHQSHYIGIYTVIRYLTSHIAQSRSALLLADWRHVSRMLRSHWLSLLYYYILECVVSMSSSALSTHTKVSHTVPNKTCFVVLFTHSSLFYAVSIIALHQRGAWTLVIVYLVIWLSFYAN